MIINSTNNCKYSFTSLNNPIKPFSIITPKGQIDFAEINYRHLPKKNSTYKKIAKFFIDIFANSSSDPDWQPYRFPTLDKAIYDEYIDYLVRLYKSLFKQNDTTILIGKDKSKNIVGAILAHPLKISPTVRDSDTLYIDSLAVSEEYRMHHLGDLLLSKVLTATSKRFSDVFLVAYKEAIPFYYKLGFKPLDLIDSSSRRFVIEEVAKEHTYYPEYADFLSRPLEKVSQSDWCTRVAFRNIPKF